MAPTKDVSPPRRKSSRVKVQRQTADQIMEYDTKAWLGKHQLSGRSRKTRKQDRRGRPRKRPRHDPSTRNSLIACVECISIGRRGYARYSCQEDMIGCTSGKCLFGIHGKCLAGYQRKSLADTQSFLCQECSMCKICRLSTGKLRESSGEEERRVIWCFGCLTCYHLHCVQNAVPSGEGFHTTDWKCSDCVYSSPVEWKTLTSITSMPGELNCNLIGDNNVDDFAQPLAGKGKRYETDSPKFTSIWKKKKSDSGPILAIKEEALEVHFDLKQSNLYNNTQISPPVPDLFAEGLLGGVYKKGPRSRLELALWSVEHCAEYFADSFPEFANLIHKHEMDGSTLLVISRQQFIELFGLKLGPALNLHAEVCLLRRSLF